jgi:hypothetical protein
VHLGELHRSFPQFSRFSRKRLFRQNTPDFQDYIGQAADASSKKVPFNASTFILHPFVFASPFLPFVAQVL